MYTPQERRAYNVRYYSQCNEKKRAREIAALRANKEEVSQPSRTIFTSGSDINGFIVENEGLIL